MIFRAPKWAQSVLRSECGTGIKQVRGLFHRHVSVTAVLLCLLFAQPQSIWAGKKTVNFTPTMLDPAGKIMPSTLRGWLSSDDKNAHMGKTCDKYWNDTLLWQMSVKNMSKSGAIATVSGQTMWQYTSSASTPNGYLMYGQDGSKYGLFSNLYVLGGTINFNNASNIAAYFYVGRHNCSAAWSSSTSGTTGLATTTGVVTNNADLRHMYCQLIPNGANSSLSLPASSDIFTYPNITKEYALLFKWSAKSATFYVKNIEFIYAIPEIVNYTNQLEVEYDGEAPEEGQSIVKEWIFNTKEVVAPSDLRLKVNDSECAYPGCFAIVQQDGADFKYTPGSNGAGTVSVKVQYTASAASVAAGNVTSPVYTLETTSVCDPSAADPGTGSGQYEAKDVDFSLVVAHAVTGPITNTLAWNIDETQLANTTWTQTEYLKTQNSEEPIHIEIVSSTPSGVAELLTGDQIHFVKAGTVTIRATQDANSEVQAADITRTFTISRRTAILDYSESTLFVNTEYPGLISVTNDPNGTLLPNLSYSGADTYMDIEKTGDVATKSARTASTTLTITYDGDDEWNPVSTTHDFKVVNKLPAPPFCLVDLDNILERISDGVFITKETNGSFAWNGSALQVTTTGNTYTLVTVRFDGIPNKISFTPSTNIQNLTIKESSDGVDFASIRTDASATAGTKVEVAFTKPASRYVQIGVRVSGSGGTVNLNNFCISDKPMFTVSPSVAYVKTDGITSTPAVIRVAHNDMRSIDVTSSDPDFTISEWTTESGSPIGEGNNGVVQAEVDFVGSNYSKIATLTLTGEPSSGDNIIQTVTVRLNATHDRHYAKGRAYVVSESGSGTVYVGATSAAPVSSAYRVNSETQKYCSAEMGETDDLTFHYWAKAGAGYEFEGWYGMYEEETAELSDLISHDEHFSIDLHATSTDPENPTTGTLYANFIESVAADAPIFALEDLNLGSVVSGEGNLQGNLVLQPVGEATRPLYIDRDRTTVAFTDIAGHEGEAALFSAGAYSMGLKAFAVTFAQTGVHPAAHTYQALATVTATNDMGTTTHTAVVSATVTPAALASFTVDASHTFADKQRNQTDTWNAVVGSLTNATTTPVITITGTNAEYFSAGAWDAEDHLFPITFAPTAVGANYTATATISVQNYDEVVTNHTITLKGTCVAAPAAVYDVKDSENQSVVGGDLYFGDFNPGEQATRKLYLVDIANMKEAPGYVPTISMEPDIEGEFVSAAYNASTHSFDVTFHAYGRTDEEMGVRSVPVTITMLNNDDAPTLKTLTLSAFVVRPADYDVRVTASDGAKLLEGSWAEGLAIANANNNSTLRLMRDVTLNMSTAHIQDITNNINLDLNGKTLTVSNLDATYYTALRVKNGKTLKINDSKTGGKMIASGASAGRLYAVEVEDGALVLKSGRLDIANTNKSAVGVYVKAGKSFTMNGGELNSRSTGTEGYGVHGEVSGASRAQITINNGTLNAYANANAYGLRGYCDFFVNGGTIHAETTTGANAHGIDLLAAADATAANGYAASLTMNAGTVEAVSKTTSAYGIRANASFVGSNQEVANTVVHGGSISALATTTGAYGVYVGGDYNSHNSTRFTTHIDDASVDAQALTGTAYGVYVDATADAATGTTRQGDVDMAETQVTAKTVNSGNTAYGVYLKTTMVKGTGSHSTEVFATASKAVISGGTYKAEAKGTNGYGICTDVRVATLEGDIYPSLSVTDAYIEGKSGGNEARAISSGGNTNVIGGTLVANAGGNNAYGIFANTGTVTASGVTITSETNATAYGVYLYSNVATVAGITVANYATATLNNLDVTATTRTGTEARGISLNTAVSGEVACAGGVTVNGGTYRATAATTTAYGAVLSKTAVSSTNAATASPSGTFKNVNFIVKTNGTTSATGIYAGGDVTIDGCNITVQPKTSTGIGIRQVSNTATVTNSTFDVQATADAHLFYGEASVSTTGYQFQGSFDLGIGNNCTAAATSGNGAYAVTLKLANGSGTYASTFAAATAVIRDGAYKATASGTTAYAINIDAINSGHAPYCEINGGKLWAKATSAEGICNRNNMTRTYVEINGGIYNINTYIAPYIPAGSSVSELADTRAEYSEGYRYEIALTVPLSQMVCQIGSTKYATLAEALAVVASGQTIYMIADYTVPEGDYTLPAGTTLLIPYKTGSGAGATTAIGAAASTTTSGTTPSKFRKLTFASGAHLTALGTIETSAQQKANGQYGANVGMTSGPYGQIHLNEGAHISLENGAKLYCWGYVTGKGTIDAKNGSTSLEGFQLGDWCGGTNASNLIGNSQKVFPVTHYFYQNIECPITYRPGAKAIGSTHINVSILGVQGQDNIALVGTSGSMFIMDNKDAKEDTWVIKDYDETTDQCVWTVNSGASIGNLTVKVSSYNLASANYDLPITTNMSIVINYGTVSIGQNAVFLPGSKLIVNKEGTADINGVTVVAYDTGDWTGTKRYFASYSPTWGTANPRNKAATLVDAEFFVHGKINIRNNGGIYTSASGANIHSTNADAGEIIYTTAATGDKTSYFLVQGGTNKTALTVNPARLLNGDGTYTASAGTVAGKTWTYINDTWQCWSKDGCFFRDAQDNYYAKPAELVQLSSGTPDANHLHHDAATGTHNYIWDADCYWWEVETTPATEGVYKSLNPDHNGKYNYYEYNESAGCWNIKTVKVRWSINSSTTEYTINYGTKPKWLGAEPTKASGSTDYTCVWDGWTKGSVVYSNDDLPIVTGLTLFTAHFTDVYVQCEVTFKDGDGRVLEVRNVNKGSTPEAYEGTPTKTATASRLYTFNGNWSPAIGAVTASTTYTAQFDEVVRQYTVTFLNYDNTTLETKNVNYGATPVYTGTPATPTRTDDTYIYTFLGWKNQLTGTNGLSVVDGPQTYTAQYTKVPKYYNIRFEDADGTTLQAERVLNGATPVAPANPARDADAQYTYTFNAWSPAVTAATENKTYIATYNTSVRSYTIRFLDYEGNNIIAPQVLIYGSTPVEPVSVPDKSASEEFANWDDVIRTVSETKDYIAQYRHKRYSLVIASNNLDYGTVSSTSLTNIQHGSTVVISGNSFTVDGKTVTATPAPETAQYIYTFDHWENVPDVVTGNVSNITAVFTRTLRQYTITWLNDDGSQIDQTEVDYGVVPTHEPATKDNTAEYTYTFTGWDNTPVAVTGNATYKATFSSAKNKYTITWLNEDDSEIDHTDVEYGVVPTHSDPTKASTVQYDYPFTGWSPAVVAVTAEATYKATFNNPVIRSYNVTWKNYDGSTITTDVYNYGVQPSYSGSTPTYSDGTGALYTFKGWKHERTNIEYALGATLPEVAGEETFTAQYSSISELVVTEANPVEITNNTTVDVTTVKISGKLVVSAGTLTTNDLILEASADGSCDINGAEHITATGHVYFDYDFNTDPWHWTAFGVPFEIDLDEAAPKKDKKNPMNSLGNDYDIVYFNTANRAAHGPGKHCWDYLDKQAEHKLRPGVLYMIAFNKHVGHVDTVRFTKASTAAINYTESVALTTTGTGTDDNWNGIANPRIYHAVLAAGVTECQVHDGGEIGKDGYHLYDMNNKKFFVGKAAFVNVPNGQSAVTTTPATTQGEIVQKAPRRAYASTSTGRYDVQIAPADGEMEDCMFLLADEEKVDEYVIVADLAKMGVSPVRAQMWVDKYGVKLCKNTASLLNNQANYPLGIAVPATGEYDIYINEQPDEDAVLYLTLDGKPIWNLSYGAYRATLEKGTTSRYGLRLVKKSPNVATGIEETTIENGKQIRKVLVDDKVYIIRNGFVYTIDGQMVK